MSQKEVKFFEVIESIESFKNEMKNIDNEIKKINQEIKRLTEKEHFIDAQKQLEVRNGLYYEKEVLREKIEQSEVLKVKLEKNLEDEIHFKFENQVVYQVCVYSPKTQNFTNVSYLDSGDTIQVYLDDMSFESEAYHLGVWCDNKGFIMNTKQFRIEKWNKIT